MKEKFTYIGLTEAHGKIFRKGKIELVIYWGGLIRYYPFGCPGKCWERLKDGRNFHFHGDPGRFNKNAVQQG